MNPMLYLFLLPLFIVPLSASVALNDLNLSTITDDERLVLIMFSCPPQQITCVRKEYAIPNSKGQFWDEKAVRNSDDFKKLGSVDIAGYDAILYLRNHFCCNSVECANDCNSRLPSS